MAILTPEKVDFREKKITKDKQGPYVMTKRVNSPRKHSSS